MRFLLILSILTCMGCSNKLLTPDSFDIHATHDLHQINGGFWGFSWDIEDDLSNE